MSDAAVNPNSKPAAGRWTLPHGQTTPLEWVIIIVAIVAGLSIAFLPAATVAPRQAFVALGLATFTVAMWATGAMPAPLAAALFMGIALVGRVASPGAVLTGFVSSTVWLVYGGLVIGTAAERTGFGRWVARHFLGGFQGSYSRLVLGILIGTSVLSFLVPSNMGRLAITVPIVAALAREAGYKDGSSGYVGLVVTAVLGNFTTALGVLPANLLNIMIVGTGEALYGVHITYVRYLVMCLPVLGLAKAFLVWRAIPLIYPAPEPKLDQTSSAAAAGTLGTDALRVAGLLALAILLWSTDFLHGIRPGWVAMLIAVLLAMPRLGVLAPFELIDRKRLILVVWIAGVISLSGVVQETGASKLLSGWVSTLAAVEGKSALYGSLAIAYVTSIMTCIATMGGTIPTMMAVVGDFSRETGLPLEAGILSVSAGMTALLFPFVAAPMVVGLTLGRIPVAQAVRFTVPTAIVSWLVIIPLNALWWKLLGALP